MKIRVMGSGLRSTSPESPSSSEQQERIDGNDKRVRFTTKEEPWPEDLALSRKTTSVLIFQAENRKSKSTCGRSKKLKSLGFLVTSSVLPMMAGFATGKMPNSASGQQTDRRLCTTTNTCKNTQNRREQPPRSHGEKKEQRRRKRTNNEVWWNRSGENEFYLRLEKKIHFEQSFPQVGGTSLVRPRRRPNTLGRSKR